ncbi:MAG: helix-turn-helix transcriptional regulator, partial [Clostridia bacterium]|nr:helix-turn-helix transcriptional regulator [Clostridia bacterium]
LLFHICKERVQMHQKRFSHISSGIELLESDPLCNLSIEEIAQSCNVGACYFRRLFKEYSGKSPLEYRMDLRLNMSKSMLESGEATLEYISEALNFESTSYFCRIFKKKFGITPGQFFQDGMSCPQALASTLEDLNELTPTQLEHVRSIIKDIKR